MPNNYSDEKINLVLNELDKNIYKQLKESGELKDNELYLLPEDDLETANYATKEELDNYVTLGTTQTIPSRKTFANTITSKTPFSAAQANDVAMNNYTIIDSNGNDFVRDYIQKVKDGSVKRYIRIQNNERTNASHYGGIFLSMTKDGSYLLSYSGSGTLSIPDAGYAIPNMNKVNSRITAIMDTSRPHYVTHVYKAADSSTSVISRKWNDGLKEQWVWFTIPSSHNGAWYQFIFPYPFNDTAYICTTGGYSSSSVQSTLRTFALDGKTTTSIKVYVPNGSGGAGVYAIGY